MSSSSESDVSFSNNVHFTSTSSDGRGIGGYGRRRHVYFPLHGGSLQLPWSFHIPWNWRGGGAIHKPNGWCLKCVEYNASHTKFVQEFDQLHLGRVWWIGILVVETISTHSRSIGEVVMLT